MVQTASGAMAVDRYFASTREITIYLAEVFKILWPQYYTQYEAAFKAGAWIQTDPGPFIGRAVIYKLQSSLHLDKNDAGPTVTFPIGQFDGGYMDLPQLMVRLL